jgi:hypothetical protein
MSIFIITNKIKFHAEISFAQKFGKRNTRVHTLPNIFGMVKLHIYSDSITRNFYKTKLTSLRTN